MDGAVGVAAGGLSGISWHYFPGAHGCCSAGTACTCTLASRTADRSGHLPAAAPLTLLPAGAALRDGADGDDAGGAVRLGAVDPWSRPRAAGGRSAAGRWARPGPFVDGAEVRWVHLDDVLAMLAAAWRCGGCMPRHAGRAGLAVAPSVAAKPWAIGAFTLLLLLCPVGRPARGGRPAGGCASPGGRSCRGPRHPDGAAPTARGSGHLRHRLVGVRRPSSRRVRVVPFNCPAVSRGRRAARPLARGAARGARRPAGPGPAGHRLLRRRRRPWPPRSSICWVPAVACRGRPC